LKNVRIKICGVTRAQDARLAEKLGAYAIGLNFYENLSAPSLPPTLGKFASISLHHRSVGVFVNWNRK